MDKHEILSRIKSGIASKDVNAEIYLYGSRARGDNRKDSDWDILVISSRDKINFDYESDLRDPILDIELESGEIISLIVYSRSDWYNNKSISPLFANVRKEGIKI
ncbi:MAG: nucleotidyltransferase domain-containing protein [Alphaproteobacteria bacterium]|nr:MAG: nucleotidyltransferase domain-containing protein [Alphaproteobacteria bacterium]